MNAAEEVASGDLPTMADVQTLIAEVGMPLDWAIMLIKNASLTREWTEHQWRATSSGRLLGRDPDRIERHSCGCVTGWDDAYEQCVLSRCGGHAA